MENLRSKSLQRDPTYVQEEIRSKPEWDLAFVLSEIYNDEAPINWSRYIGVAKSLLSVFDISRKNDPNKQS